MYETITTTADDLPLSTISKTCSAMFQALNVSEITSLIRRELRGVDLKSMVRVNHQWWKAFGPYLWEKVYIDADPDKDDRQVIFRNGLAATSLTLSIYDAKDARGVVGYVAEKCQNIYQLHLKLFAPDLAVVNKNVDISGQQRDFATREETDITLLDKLLSQLPFVTELTLSIAHEHLLPEILWCVTSLSNLRKLTVYGGLRVGQILIRKNKRCNWTLVSQVATRCPVLESLVVGWECPVGNTHQQLLDQGVSPIPSLRFFEVCFSTVDHSQLDQLYPMSPNLRELTFYDVKVSHDVLKHHVQAVTTSCSQLKSFKFTTPTHIKDRSHIQTLLCGPLLNVPSLKLCLGRQYPQDIHDMDHHWSANGSMISVLHLEDIHNFEVVFKIMTTMTGLSRLTLGGVLPGEAEYPNDDAITGYSKVVSYYDNEQYSEGRLSEFACKDSLQYLNVTQLDILSLKFHIMFFQRVQGLTQLKRMEISHKQLQDARLEETWTDPDEDPDLLTRSSVYPDKVIDPRTIPRRLLQNTCRFGVPYVRTMDTDYGPEGGTVPHRGWNSTSSISDEALESGFSGGRVMVLPDKTFAFFRAVEFLYVLDCSPMRNFQDKEHYISEHMASALVRMMPKLKVMSFDRALGVGLRRVKRIYPHVIFDCTS